MEWIDLLVWTEAVVILIASVVLVFLVMALREERRNSHAASVRLDAMQRESMDHATALLEAQGHGEWNRILFDSTHGMVLVYGITDDGIPDTFLDVNEAACAELGYTREQFRQMTPMDIDPSEIPLTSSGISKSDASFAPDQYLHDQQHKAASNAARRLIRSILDNGEFVYETVCQARDGTQIPVEIHARPVQLGDRTVVLSAMSDITQQKKNRKEIEEIRRRFQDFFSISPIGIAMYDPDRNLVDVNPACLRMFGIPGRQEFGGLDFFQGDLVPESVRRQTLGGETVRFETVVDFDDVRQHARFVTSRAGSSYFAILVNSTWPDRQSKPRGFFVQVLDITEQRKMEIALQSNEQLLRQAEKMEAIGAMAGGIAHDFNNILTPIIGYTKMMLRLVPPADQLYKFVQGIQKASERAKSLVAQILAFSRKGDDHAEVDLHPTHVVPIVKEVINLQRASLPLEIEIKRVIRAEQDVIRADPTKIHQILMNLCTNAGHAMRGMPAGVLEVSVMGVTIEQRSKSAFSDVEPGRYLEVAVRDSGSGMEPATMARIFEPFFTTKKKGEGTGMGLAVVHGIVRSYRGAIAVESEPGKGSTFRVVFPLVESAVVEKEAEAEAPSPLPRGTESLLIVDDEQDNLDMLKYALEPLGYAITTCASSEDALGLVLSSSKPFDLIMTDQVMPRLTGMELSQRLLNANPGQRILMFTGHSENLTEEQAKAAGIREFLRKPLELDQVAHVIRQVLERR